VRTGAAQKNWKLLRGRRLKHITTLLKDRCPRGLPDDDAGREYLFELLLVISTVSHGDIKMPYTIRAWAPWMLPNEATQLIDQINRIPIWHRWRTGKELGKHLRLTNGERERMKLWSIWPYNMSKAELHRQRRAKDRERKRQLRQARGNKSRKEWLADNSVSRTKPWERAGFKCRRTWERHGKPAAPGAAGDEWWRNSKLPDERLEPALDEMEPPDDD